MLGESTAQDELRRERAQHSSPPSLCYLSLMALIVPAGLKDATEQQLCALLEVMYHVAKSDGVFSHEELTHFLAVGNTISAGKISAAQLAIVVHGWEQEPVKDIGARFEELAQVLLSPHHREMACNLAAQLAESDDAVLRPEQDVLNLLGEKFFGM